MKMLTKIKLEEKHQNQADPKVIRGWGGLTLGDFIMANSNTIFKRSLQ